MLGSDLSYHKAGTVEYEYFNYASVIQDILLGVNFTKFPVCLPKQVFGLGKPPAYLSNKNFLTISNKVKESHSRIMFQIAKELVGDIAPNLILKRSGVTLGQKHFESESIIEFRSIAEDDPIRNEIIIREDQWDLFPVGVIEKLVSGGYLALESKLVSIYMLRDRINQLDQTIHVDTFSKYLHEFSSDPKEMAEESLSKFVKAWRSTPYLFRNYKRENVYFYEVIDRLSEYDPLGVKTFPLKETYQFGGYEEIMSSYGRQVLRLFNWFVENYRKILAGESFTLPPVDILSDDEIIPLRLEDYSGNKKLILVVTDDVKLLRRLNSLFQPKEMVIFGIPIEDYAVTDYDDVSWVKSVSEYFRIDRRWVELEVDTGSLEAFLYEREDKRDYPPSKFCEELPGRIVSVPNYEAYTFTARAGDLVNSVLNSRSNRSIRGLWELARIISSRYPKQG